MAEKLITLKEDEVEYEDDEEIEEVVDFDFSGYQVVRREFYAHLYEPAVSYKFDSIQFNTACVNKIDSLYVHIYINPKEKKMVIRECNEDDKDAVRWCRVSKKTGKRVPRKVLCKLFALKIYDLLGWNVDYRYKIQGTLIRNNGELLVVFNLTETEIYMPNEKDENGVVVKAKPRYPEEWRDTFGVPVSEHNNSMIVNLLEGYSKIEVVQKRIAKKKKEDVVESNQISLFDITDSGGGNNGN